MVYDNENNQEDKNIRGKALYFSTSQVATVLNQPDSKIRYYTNVFDEILHIEISNKQRRYTEADIDKLRFIIELKEEGMTIKQIQEYCQEVDFENSKEIQVKENNPLSIQAIAKALLEQQSQLMNEMEEHIVDKVVNKIIANINIQTDQFNDMKNNLTKDVAITVEETMNRELKKSNEEFKIQIDNNFNEISDKIVEKIVPKFYTMTAEEYKKLNEQQPKNLFAKIEKLFNKKKY